MKCILVAIFMAFAVPQLTSAAEISSTISKQGNAILILNGEIVPGDADQVTRLIKSANDTKRVVTGIRLNSPGGNLLEGAKLADIIRYGKIATVVTNHSTCASACFVVFAAGNEKYANYTAQIGVHGASDQSGKETVESGAATVSMARICKDLGVPSNIIGKMVVTPPSQMVWLAPNDLRSMGTSMLGKPSQTAPQASTDTQLPAQIAPDTQAKKEELSWKNLVAGAVKISSEQNRGSPNVLRSCQPEMKICNMGIYFKGKDGKEVLIRKTEDLKGQMVSRDVCTFNEFKDVRTCVNWDSGKVQTDMKNAQGQWIQVNQ